MDPLKHHRRLGLTSGADMPDELLVKTAKSKDTESARLILQLCYWRLCDNAVTKLENQMTEFFDKFGFGEMPLIELDNHVLSFAVADAEKCISQNGQVLGPKFTNYLLDCFASLKDDGSPPVSVAFKLRPAKGAGRSIEFERDLEVAEDVQLILTRLKSGRLNKHIAGFLNGESARLPQCIERIIRLHGFPTTSGYDPKVRQQLADTISNEYKPVIRRRLADSILEVTIANKKNSFVASEIYIQCTKACATFASMIIEDERLSDSDRKRLTELLDTLNCYGAVSRGKGKHGIGLPGIQNIYKKNHKKLPDPKSRAMRMRSIEELEKIVARDHPIIRKASRIIKSPDVGNHNRAELLNLQKQTPKDAQLIWPDLWEEFGQALVRVAAKQNELQSQAQLQ